jgi:hypothetical protein
MIRFPRWLFQLPLYQSMISREDRCLHANDGDGNMKVSMLCCFRQLWMHGMLKQMLRSTGRVPFPFASYAALARISQRYDLDLVRCFDIYGTYAHSRSVVFHASACLIAQYTRLTGTEGSRSCSAPFPSAVQVQ